MKLRCCLLGWQLFLDTRRLAAAIAEVVQLGTTHVTTALHFDAGDQGAVGLECTFHAFAAGDLAHDKAAVQTTVALGNHHAFVGLHALAVTFDDVNVHNHGVAGSELRDVFAQASNFFLLKSLDQVHDFLRDLASAGTGIGAIQIPIFGNCLANSLDADWLNVAQVGASNSWILRYASQVIDLLANDTQYKKIYFVVTLTESGREVGLDCEYDPSWEKYNISDPLLYDNILEDLEHSWCDKIHTIQQKLDSRYWFYIGQNFAWHQGVDQTCRDLEINASDNTWVELIYRAKGIEMPCRSNIVTQFAFYEFSSCNKKLSITDLSKYKSWSICKIDEANSVLSWMEDHGWIHPEPKRFHPYIDGHQIWFNHIADKINATKSSY